MNHVLLIGTLLLITAQPSFAHHHVSFFQECEAYEIEEKYLKGRYDAHGNYIRGKVTSHRTRVPCPTTLISHHPYPPQQHQYPAQPPQNYIQTSREPSRCDGLSRVLIGGLGGGIAGRYIGGGTKSRHTIRNTTIGAVTGGLLGRLLPC